ncbi:condensation domain-containing protein [Promicromonospora xylanilytica]
MDHLHTDAWSTTVVVDELAARYAAHAGGAPGSSGGVAPHTVEARGARRPGVAATSGAAAAPGPGVVSADDPRLATWHGFLRDQDWALPTFPLPLGVPDGERVPQRTVVRRLTDAGVTAALAARARGAGASTSAAVLATLAQAVADLGGPTELRTLLPVHTRDDAAARRAVGWYTTTVPLRIEAGAPGAPVRVGGVPDTALAATGKAVRAARELSAVPLEQVVVSLPAPLRFPRVDIFQVSYLDYRRLPGHAAAAERRAHHVSAATRADDLQLWVSRTDDGVAVRARMPHTDVAVETVDALLDRWAGRLAGLAAR